MKILITGVAGFIGFNLALNLIKLKTNLEVFGIDNLNNNTKQIKIKKNRLQILKQNTKKFKFSKIDISNFNSIKKYCFQHKFNVIINLAAEAGVRNSYDNPANFFESNLAGFFNILHCSKLLKVDHFIYASSSSVYGDNKIFPQKESLNTDHPESFYAATKKSNEILAHAYSNNYNFKCTGLRFFTVYGPYGREDMSLYKFTDSILNNRKLELYNFGKHYRDFTYIDDVIEAIKKVLFDKKKRKFRHKIYNIGYGKSKSLKIYLNYISQILNKNLKVKNLKHQRGDVYKTLSDISSIKKDLKYSPKINLLEGIKKYLHWYKKYY